MLPVHMPPGSTLLHILNDGFENFLTSRKLFLRIIFCFRRFQRMNRLENSWIIIKNNKRIRKFNLNIIFLIFHKIYFLKEWFHFICHQETLFCIFWIMILRTFSHLDNYFYVLCFGSEGSNPWTDWKTCGSSWKVIKEWWILI